LELLLYISQYKRKDSKRLKILKIKEKKLLQQINKSKLVPFVYQIKKRKKKLFVQQEFKSNETLCNQGMVIHPFNQSIKWQFHRYIHIHSLKLRSTTAIIAAI
jgi:hypothetical protein